MEKKERWFEVFKHLRKPDDDSDNYTWGEFIKLMTDNNIKPEDTDEITIEHDGRERCYSIVIRRWRLETDEEFEARVKETESSNKSFRNRRYEEYLNLKKEFEADENK